MTSSSVIPKRIPAPWLWAVVLLAMTAFLAYKLHDLQEPFAFGNARWSDAYEYVWARAHLDLGLTTTLGLNVEGVTQSGEPIFYLSPPPLLGLSQAGIVFLLGGEFWTVRVLPLLFNAALAGLLAAFAFRQQGASAAAIAALLFLGMPFTMEYGSSNEGGMVYANVTGMAGYLLYLRFLTSGRWLHLVLSVGCFALGLGFNWHVGFMAVVMLGHLWLQPLAFRTKILATFLTGAALGSVVLAFLIQQGVATGEFFYPFKRAMQRSRVPMGGSVSFATLLEVQVIRYWTYFGQVISILSVYWLLRRMLPKPNWGRADTWAVLMWAPGLVYGLLLRDAAYGHDYLLLGFLPGAVLMATLGLLTLLDDLWRASAKRYGRWPVGLAAAVLLGTHAVVAVRSAQNFERQEADDLARGGAKVAFHLRDLPRETMVASDWSAISMVSRVDRLSKERFVSIHPFADYFVRRPVRVVKDIGELRKLMCSADRLGLSLVLLHARMEDLTGPRLRIVDGIEVKPVQVPATWVSEAHSFDRIDVFHLNRKPPEGCN